MNTSKRREISSEKTLPVDIFKDQIWAQEEIDEEPILFHANGDERYWMILT